MNRLTSIRRPISRKTARSPAWVLAFLWMLLVLPAANASPPLQALMDLPDLVEKVLPGVVNISSSTTQNYTVYGMDVFMRFWGIPQERKQTSLGSGFIIDQDGYVITNNHVVDHATEVTVTLQDKREFQAKIIGKDQKTDLALLQLRDKNKKVPQGLKPVPFGSSDSIRIAEPVFAVGNPFGLQHTVTTGIISAKNRTIGLGPLDNFLQTDASINPGNSGGPLFNLKGEVIGINTVIYSRTGQSGGLGFAIPIAEAKKILPDLKRYGRVPRPWLGILGQGVTPPLQRTYGLPLSKGVVIYNLVNGGPAEEAGLQQGDIIESLDSISVDDLNLLEKQLYTKRPKEAVTLKVRRGSRSLELKIQLEELPRLENLPQGIV